MEFKPVTLEKLPEIVDLNFTIFDGMYDRPPYSLEQYQERFRGIEPTIFVAEEDGKIIGDSVSFARDGEWYIWILGVSKEYRKQGVATKLFEMNEQYAKENGYKTVAVKVYNVSKEMLKVAIGRGYQVTGVETDEMVKNNAVILKLVL